MKTEMKEIKDSNVTKHKQKCSMFMQMEMVYLVRENFLISKGDT